VVLVCAQHAAAVSRRVGLAASLGIALLLAAAPGRSEDSDQTRYYLSLRFGEITPGLVKAHDAAGGSLGVNLGRHLGFEFALDSYEVKVGEVSEMSVLGLIPNVRLRYPLLHDRLTPYMLGGLGMTVSQANDARAPVEWKGGKNGVQLAGTLGGGIEYFIADNLAVGLEGKYLFSGTVDYTSEGTSDSIGLSSALVSLGIRAFYPELHPVENAEAARKAFARFYLAPRLGAALLVDMEPFAGIHATPEQSVFGSNFTQQFGVSVGATIGPYASVEVAVDNYEFKLSTANLGGIGEYAVFPILVQPRLRYPLLDGSLVPYVLAGVGAEYAQINDRTPSGGSIELFGRDLTVIGGFGAGLDYALLSNVSVGGFAKYIISRGHTFQIDDGPVLSGDLDAFILSLQLTIFFYNV
jgi:opacity protein-like surface antigen